MKWEKMHYIPSPAGDGSKTTKGIPFMQHNLWVKVAMLEYGPIPNRPPNTTSPHPPCVDYTKGPPNKGHSKQRSEHSKWTV